jgi:hypothetical protein
VTYFKAGSKEAGSEKQKARSEKPSPCSDPTLDGRPTEISHCYLQQTGKGGIRTLDTIAGISVFETDAFSRSATFPYVRLLLSQEGKTVTGLVETAIA